MSVTRNAAYNLAGFVVPLLLFLVTIPIYISLIGAARYGVLAIVWLVLGLFGMMDLGLGRAATQRIAALRDGSAEERRIALGTALATNLVIGAIGALLMGGAAYYVFGYGMKLDDALRAEAMPLVPLMALGVPIVTTLAILSGALMGREKFFIVNRISITNTALFQLAPLTIAWLVGPELVWLVVAALCARFIAVLLLLRESRTEFGGGALRQWSRSHLSGMLKYGGWITLTSFLGIILVFSDRFVIGALLGPAIVSAYVLPLDLTRRIALFADAFGSALFPRLSSASSDAARSMGDRSTAGLFAITTPIVAMSLPFLPFAITLWLSGDLGRLSAQLVSIMLLAGWINLIAKISVTKMQAVGRPDILPKVLIVETPIFIIAIYLVIPVYGVLGAAIILLIRNSLDTIIFLLIDKQPAKLILAVLLSLILLAAPTLYQATHDYSLGLASAQALGVIIIIGMCDQMLRNITTGGFFVMMRGFLTNFWKRNAL